MKACCYCRFGVEDDQGTYCAIDWDTLEYEPQAKQDKIKRECHAAKEIVSRMNKE